MILEDIKAGDTICIANFINFRVVEFIEFLSYDQCLCKYNEDFVIFNVSDICLDDEKIILIKEYVENKNNIDEFEKCINILSARNNELYNLIKN